MKTKLTAIVAAGLLLGACTSSEKKIEQAREKNPRYQYNVGIFYLNNGQPDEAMVYLQKALALDSRFDLALDGMGLAYTMKGDLNQAVKYFEQCLAANPNLTDAHNHLGSVYQEMGLLDKAEEKFLAAVLDQSYHSRELPLYNLARLYYLQEKNEQAMEYINRALTVNRRLEMAHNLKGLIYERFERFQEAIVSYQDALKIRPDDINLTYNLAGAYFKNRNFQKAKELFSSLESKVIDPEMKANITKYMEMIGREIRS
jgi:tetratricopeptide (TPR) repeat protein